MSISAEVSAPGGVGGSVAGAKRNGADGGKGGEVEEDAESSRDRGTECDSGLSSEATLFGSNKSFGWGLRDGISESGKFRCGGRCGGLVKFLKGDGTIRNDNIVSFDIGLPGGSVIRCTLLK